MTLCLITSVNVGVSEWSLLLREQEVFIFHLTKPFLCWPCVEVLGTGRPNLDACSGKVFEKVGSAHAWSARVSK